MRVAAVKGTLKANKPSRRGAGRLLKARQGSRRRRLATGRTWSSCFCCSQGARCRFCAACMRRGGSRRLSGRPSRSCYDSPANGGSGHRHCRARASASSGGGGGRRGGVQGGGAQKEEPQEQPSAAAVILACQAKAWQAAYHGLLHAGDLSNGLVELFDHFWSVHSGECMF
jgi:hypothetical protein